MTSNDMGHSGRTIWLGADSAGRDHRILDCSTYGVQRACVGLLLRSIWGTQPNSNFPCKPRDPFDSKWSNLSQLWSAFAVVGVNLGVWDVDALPPVFIRAHGSRANLLAFKYLGKEKY